MSDQKNIDPKATPVPDDLTKTKKVGELSEKDLKEVSGGGDIPGDATKMGHEGWVEIQ